MAGADDIFAAFKEDSLAHEGRRQVRQEGYEETVIKKILAYAGVTIPLHAARAMAREETNSRSLTFSWFHAAYPGFPVYMGAKKLSWTAQLRVNELFGKGFMKLSPVIEYQKFCNTMNYNTQKDRVALVFNLPHADASATMVLHNQPVQAQNMVDPEQRREPETRILRPYGNPRVTFVLESLHSFFETVGTDWATG